MTEQNSSITREASTIAVDEAGKPLLCAPPNWRGLPINLFPIPSAEERSPSYLECPVVLLVLRGQGRRWYREGGKILDLDTTPGGVEVLGSDYHREWGRWEGTPGLTVGLHLTPQVVSRLIPSIPDFSVATTHEFFDQKIQWLMRELLAEAQRGAPGGGLYVESLSCALLAYIAEAYGKGKACNQPVGALSAINRHRIIDYIEAHLGEEMSITGLAKEVGLSPDHFARCFAASFGQPPHRYVRQRRIELARRMLTLSSRSIAEISSELGFSDQSHFTRVYRQQTGMTPSQTRSSRNSNVTRAAGYESATGRS